MATLYLLKGVTLDPNYETSIDFESKEAQLNYFNTYQKMAHDTNLTYSYLRSNEAIDVPYKFEDLGEVNYLYYINNNKVYYNFVTRKEFINNNSTRLYIELDVFQTYMFDYELGECFVEREHQDRYDNNHNFIYNVESENLDIGKYIVENYKTPLRNTNLPSGFSLSYYYVVSTKELGTSQITSTKNTTMYNSIDTNLYVYCLPKIDTYYEGNLYYKEGDNYYLLEVGRQYEYGRSEILLKEWAEDPAIISVSVSKISPFSSAINTYTDGYYISPTNVYLKSQSIVLSGDPYTFYFLQLGSMYRTSNTMGLINNPKITNLNSVVLGENKNISREPKLLTYPYNYNEVLWGDNKIDVLNELIEGNSLNILGYKTLGGKSTEVVILQNYKGGRRDDYMVNISINELALRTDSWINYLNNNRATIRSGLAVNVLSNSAMGIAGGAMSGGLAGAIVGAIIGGASTIANEMIKRENIKESPDTLRNTGDDVGANVILGKYEGMIINCGIEETYKNKIFGYFYRHGYRCASFKVPNIKSRYYFNFIKTTECVLKTNKVSAGYAEALKDIYNKGITIWHYRDGETFSYMDYDLENWEMSLIGGNE